VWEDGGSNPASYPMWTPLVEGVIQLSHPFANNAKGWGSRPRALVSDAQLANLPRLEQRETWGTRRICINENGDEGMRKASTIPDCDFFISLESQAISKSLEVDIAIKAGSRDTLS